MLRALLLSVLCWVVACGPGVASGQEAAESPDVIALRQTLDRMEVGINRLQDAVFTLHMREWADGHMGNELHVIVKFRRPTDIYLEMLHQGREGARLIYRGDDWNEGRLRIDPGPLLPTLNLSPDGKLARAGRRHSIREMPITIVVGQILRNNRRALDNHEQVKVTAIGFRDVLGESGDCFLLDLPKDKDSKLHASRIELCVNPDTDLPNSIRSWDIIDGKLRLVEDYQYVDLQINPGLTETDFDPERYGF